jgi:hypothetical protein
VIYRPVSSQFDVPPFFLLHLGHRHRSRTSARARRPVVAYRRLAQLDYPVGLNAASIAPTSRYPRRDACTGKDFLQRPYIRAVSFVPEGRYATRTREIAAATNQPPTDWLTILPSIPLSKCNSAEADRAACHVVYTLSCIPDVAAIDSLRSPARILEMSYFARRVHESAKERASERANGRQRERGRNGEKR